MQKNEKKIAILQRVCTAYRVPLFRKLSSLETIKVKFFIGDSLPNSKVKNAENLSDLDVLKLPTKFMNLNGRVIVSHSGLLKELIKYKPDIIICEGSSNVHSLIKAIIYRTFIERNSKIIHWSLGGLPGDHARKKIINSIIKKIINLFVDEFLVYSTYGKNKLLNDGIVNKPIGVAVNVSNVEKYISLYNENKGNRCEYREKYKLDGFLTVLYVGDFSAGKRIDTIIETANILKNKNIKFILIGDGPELKSVKNMSTDMQLDNVSFTGRISNRIFEYYIASDIFMLPGRGGMVISEAMSFGLPVLAYQADGTEYDLIHNNMTGKILPGGTADEFAEEIVKYAGMPENIKKMGALANDLIAKNYTLDNMVNNIVTLVNN